MLHRNVYVVKGAGAITCFPGTGNIDSTTATEAEYGMDDVEGYGPRPDQSETSRLLEDARTLSPAGIERAANGWDRGRNEAAFRDAEERALEVIERAGHRSQWDNLRNEILGLTERGQSLVAWKQEHGEVGHKAERALLAAALAVSAGDDLDPDHADLLRSPMAEALPWLLLDEEPRPA